MLVLVCLEIVLTLMKGRCMVCEEHTVGSEIIWMHPMDLLGGLGLAESRFNPFGDSGTVSAR
jgi:hypothetical protein